MTGDRIWASWSSGAAAPMSAHGETTVLDGLESPAQRLIIGSGPAPAGAASFTLRHRYPVGAHADPAAAPYVLAVRVYARDADRGEFRRWLDEEHCVLQMTIPGVHWYLGYEESGPQHSFLNLWGVDDPALVDGEAWERVRRTAWWDRIAHVAANADRGVYRPRPGRT